MKFVLKIIDGDGLPFWYWQSRGRWASWTRDQSKAELFASADDAYRMMDGLKVIGSIGAVEID